MKKTVQYFLIIIALQYTILAAEAECRNCIITTVQPDSEIPGTLVYSNVNSQWHSKGSCSSTASQRRMYIVEGTPMSKEIYSAALTAISTAITVDIKGTGTCVGDIETIRFIKLKK